MKMRTGVLIPAISFFLGMSIGFLVSPVRDGIGNHSGNNCGNTIRKEDAPSSKEGKE